MSKLPTWSPNRTPRPKGAKVKLIVLHSTIGGFAGAVSWLMNPDSGASAHVVVSKRGQVRKIVPLSDCAWHAGRSEWRGRSNVNRFSLGIEMEHFDRAGEVWPYNQVAAVAKYCRALFVVYGELPIVRHADICIPPGRKTDPVGFPVSLLNALLKQKE